MYIKINQGETNTKIINIKGVYENGSTKQLSGNYNGDLLLKDIDTNNLDYILMDFENNDDFAHRTYIDCEHIGDDEDDELEAKFEYVQDDICVPSKVIFINKSKPKDKITSYLWDFGDGSDPDYKESSDPIHEYKKKSGIDGFTVTLIVSDGIHPNQTYSQSVIVKNCPPCDPDVDPDCCDPREEPECDPCDPEVDPGCDPCENSTDPECNPCEKRCLIQANFSYHIIRNECEDVEVAFRDESTGNVEKWAWNFGDGSTSSMPSPVKKYTKPGIYFASLTVSKPSISLIPGCENTLCESTHTKYDIIHVKECIDENSKMILCVNVSRTKNEISEIYYED